MLKSAEYSNSLSQVSKLKHILAYPLLFIIYLYRSLLSPIFGNNCRYLPTCSHYAEDALRKYGAFKGSMMTVKRLLRCHPWHDGGYDPVE